ncbi:Detected protein of unknown function [Hibiscus syriacus]|uniref:TIR domain-containing protein n=1 Tax=Hibiscus syriacus TaxID=106335 RepID=A0A6A2ZBY1_HIBSY|nr:Detected protein of unknown function [Hibiscus syriacus]
MVSSSSELKYQVFSSFRGEDTRLNFTGHLLQALKDTGMNVFFDEEKLEKGVQLSLALSQAIAASNLSIVVLSANYASSKLCLAALSDIMGRKGSQQHTVLPIFYHVDPSDVSVEVSEHPLKSMNQIGYSMKSSDGKLHLLTSKKMILKLIKQGDNRVIGLWGMGDRGKTTLAEAVYNEISHMLQDEAADSESLPDELRYLCWHFYPFRSLSPSFNPKNHVALRLPYGHMEQLRNEDNQGLVCIGCESLVELPCLDHLVSLKGFNFWGCHKLNKFPELPNVISELDLSDMGIEELSDSIEHHVGLKKLVEELENASHCTSLEKVSFTDHNLYRFDSLKDGDEQVYLLFCNCKSLNQDSIKSIEANAVLQIQSLAQRWARREEGRIKKTGRRGHDYNRIFCRNQLFCCFPGNEIAAHEFEHRSVDSSLTLKLAPNECGRKFSGRCSIVDKNPCTYDGDHVTILFSENLIIIDDDYEEASFEFHINNDCIMVKECGVHVFYVGMEAELRILRLQAHPRRNAAESAIPMPFDTGSRLFFTRSEPARCPR